MNVNSFKELLIKKASGDENLETLIRFIDSDVLASKVMESLEKMARAAHKGDTANFAVHDFGLEMDPELEPAMLRDAIGHHVSKYKAALKENRDPLANQHAQQAFKLMNLANIAQKHSHGKLNIDFVDVKPWERNHPRLRRTFQDVYNETGEIPKPIERGNKKWHHFVNDTKGLNYQGSIVGTHDGERFNFLEQKPHEAYANEVRKHGHTGAYPFEHVRINGKYIHIDDDVQLHGFEKHPFDHHPIVEHFTVPAKHRTPEHDAKYIEAKSQYHDVHPHIDNYFDKHEKLQETNPEAYATRGAQPSAPVHAPFAATAAAAKQQGPKPTGKPGQQQQVKAVPRAGGNE